MLNKLFEDNEKCFKQILVNFKVNLGKVQEKFLENFEKCFQQILENFKANLVKVYENFEKIQA